MVFGIILALFAVVVGLPGAILAMEALRRRRAIHEATGVDIDVEASNVHETIVDSLELHYQGTLIVWRVLLGCHHKLTMSTRKQ